jgi:predicted O-methyltransferase YrrM
MQIKELILNTYGSVIHNIKGEINDVFLQQDLDEISGAINFLLEQGVKYSNFLEVGSAAGGNARVFSDLLNIKDITIIDDNQHPEHIYRHENLKHLNINEYIGNSQSAEAKAWLEQQNKKYDIVYIDGDHSYQGVLNDIENYKHFVESDGFLIFHDHIACDGVRIALDKLINEDNTFTKVFSADNRLGIFILQKKKSII